MYKKQELTIIEISKILILNSRERNELIRKEIKENIEKVGLKRPITVCRKIKPINGYEYDLVCGQGRLEAYIANNQKEIPAIIIDINEEDALIMSLVENIARRNYHPYELFQGVKRLINQSYSIDEIANKIGLSKEYISEIYMLLERGEDKLLNAVEQQKIPLNVAITISKANSNEMQSVLQDLYDQNGLRGKKLNYARKLIESRAKSGKSIKVLNSKKAMSAKDVFKDYENALSKMELLVSKASRLENILIFTVQGFKQIYLDDNFINLLKAEGLLIVPQYLVERIKSDD